jgi:glycosyltransferase involved in cell wall biosynthesis
VHRYDAFLVPGTRARALLCALDPDAATKPWVMLPNLVDARVFRDRVATLRRDRAGLRARLGVAPETQLWFCPARLAPEKGLRELLPLLAGRTGLALWIAGEGPLRAELDAMVARDRLPVRLLGQQPEETITELYAAADLFVLPSLSDPSPLSAVEAASAQLPLLLSTHAGNSDELIEHGVNGWRFDVDGGDARRALLDTVAATPASTLAAMGLRAGERYRETFDSDVCVERLARFLVELHADARSRATTRRQ